MFVDTDQVPGHETRVGELVQNDVEAELVYQFTETLIGCGIKEEQIGILSLYRQQIKVISHLLINRRGVEILTADRSQGRDKDCIIVSMVRSNDACQVRVSWRPDLQRELIKARTDRKPHEGLETIKCLLHTCSVEADHHRLTPDDKG